MIPHLKPWAGEIPLVSVDGAVHIDAVAQSNVFGTGRLEGGAKGVQYSLRELRDAIDVAIARMYPTEAREDLGYCLADFQIAARDRESAPILIISGEPDEQGLRRCVIVAGAIPDGDPRTVLDAVEVRK